MPYHDLCLAGDYIVFFRIPTIMDNFEFLMGKKTIFQSVRFKKDLGTEILIFDKKELNLIAKAKAPEGFMFYHFANGFVDDDGIINVAYCKYPDFKVWKYMQEIVTG